MIIKSHAIPVLVAVSAVFWCVSLWLARRYVTGSDSFFFLVYNLGLACLPLLVSTSLAMARSTMLIAVLGAVWLAFFPNAPYLFTDLIHLRPRTGAAPFWFDWLLFVSFAGAGLLIGCVSLAQVHGRLRKKLRPSIANAGVTGLLALTAFGVYLGRFPRWNSWDIVYRPGDFFGQVANLLIHPLDHPRMLAYSFGVTVILAMAYFAPLLVFQSLQIHGEKRDCVAFDGKPSTVEGE